MPPRSTKEAPRLPLRQVDAPLPAAVQKQLSTILHQREVVESAMAEIDQNVYDLETSYLGLCVELGGSLFDGFGLERAALVHAGGLGTGSARSGTRPTLTPASPGAGGGADNHRGFPASPLAEDEHLVGGSGAYNGSGSLSSSGLVGLASNILSSNLAFRARVHTFTPAERVFSASSVGAIGRVERLKSGDRTGAHTAAVAAGGRGVSAAKGLGQLSWSSASPQGTGKSLWASAGRRRRARVLGEGERGDEGDSVAMQGAHALLYTTTGRRKRTRDDDEGDDDDSADGLGRRGAGSRRGGMR